MAGASSAGLLIAAVSTGDVFVGMAVGLLCLLPGTLFGYILGLCLPRTVSKFHRTLGGLARGLAAVNYEQFRPSEEPATTNDPIWDQLCDVLMRYVSVQKEELYRGTRFVEDLGVT
jgi:hypothetical protein